jgi:dCTP diphosphatase
MTDPSHPSGHDLNALRRQVRRFAEERGWQKYHNPRSLLLALAGEIGELSELFQWLDDDQASAIMEEPKRAERVREEIADVFCYLLRLSDVLGIDLGSALRAKMKLNAERYPIELSRGNATKYTGFGR